MPNNNQNLQQMSFKTKDLVSRLEKNKKIHIAEYYSAMEGYHEAIEDKLKQALKAIKNGETYEKGFHLTMIPPVSHEGDYDTIIEMLKMCTDETIELDKDNFECYVMDRWSWKDNFASTTNLYAKKIVP